MATTISNNGASIRIDNGTTVRNIMKNQIIEVSVIRTNILKIDIGQGPLNNVFVPYSSVTSPATASPADLRDAINDFMANSVNSGTSGGATEAKQDNQISNQASALTKQDAANTKMDSIHTAVNDVSFNVQTLYEIVSSIDSKLFLEPRKVDESTPNIVYKGFAGLGISGGSPSWAIQRITSDNDIKSYEWADGNKNFDNVWDDRETLSYL